ncbi:glycosyltransferase family 4 protein [Pontiella agarivorans]|uniref:Glycosyltransferase family 4 protein n=1 Tax=Pontiella agarivorans TaxID=3038953 RepID=A0ABU5MSZ8_9BACT|nr:glycosyltransferase family 4 protein [Pontiella agarivorans]MDZ8117334.1 glycosyltransferase family 4 protein [Pontiella agarivorans]
MIDLMVHGIEDKYELQFIRMAFSDSVSEAGKFRLGKVWHLLSLIVKTWRALGIRRNKYLYYPPGSANLLPIIRDIIFLLLVRPFCKGLVLQFHSGGLGNYADRHPVIGFFMRLAYGRMNAGIVQGESCPDDPSAFKARERFVVPHGMDIRGVGAVGVPEEKERELRILFVGIHTTDKGVFTLAETAKILKKRNVAFKIAMVGRWYTESEELKFLQYVEQYDLNNEISMKGVLVNDELWAMYEWADIFFFPTFGETFGLVQLEAMAHGLPVVASECSGPMDVIADGETGFLCGIDQPTEFADKLALLYQQPKLIRRLGAKAKERYNEYYREKHFRDRINAVFQHVLARD